MPYEVLVKCFAKSFALVTRFRFMFIFPKWVVLGQVLKVSRASVMFNLISLLISLFNTFFDKRPKIKTSMTIFDVSSEGGAQQA